MGISFIDLITTIAGLVTIFGAVEVYWRRLAKQAEAHPKELGHYVYKPMLRMIGVVLAILILIDLAANMFVVFINGKAEIGSPFVLGSPPTPTSSSIATLAPTATPTPITGGRLPCSPCAEPRITLVLNHMTADEQNSQIHFQLIFNNGTATDVTLQFSTLNLTNNNTGDSDPCTRNAQGNYEPVPVGANSNWPVNQTCYLTPTAGATYTLLVVMELPDNRLNAYKATDLAPSP